MTVHPIIRQIVDRLHVGTPRREVFDEVISKLRGGRQTYLAMSREDRRQLLRAAAEVHRENLQLYRDVMGGGR